MIVILDVGCDSGIYFSETELWCTVSLWVCLSVSVCVCSAVRVTSLPSQSAQRGWDPGWVWDPGLKLFLLSTHFLFKRTVFIISITWQLSSNCLPLWIKVRRSRPRLIPLSCHVITSISHELLYVIPTSVFVSTSLSFKRHVFIGCVSSFCLLCVI